LPKVADLLSGGGAYLVGDVDGIMAWPGSADSAAYDSIPFGADDGLVASVLGIPVVVLGLPDPLHVVHTHNGVILAIAVCCDDEAAVEALVNGVNDDDWNAIGEFTVTGRVVVFDSAMSGADAAKHGVTLKLQPGAYDVESRMFTPDPDTELQLVRLRAR
jgi:hypothetical protein